MPNYRVKIILLTSGERLPILLDRNGMPMFTPTVFALTDEEIGTIMLKLNIRPRKRLGFIKPI